MSLFFYLNRFYLDQSDDNEDDESTLMCCEQIATSFNFTSSICRLLVLNLSCNKLISKLVNNDQAKSNGQLSENCARIAFAVMNKLTADNPLFAIDTHVKQIICCLMDKM